MDFERNRAPKYYSRVGLCRYFGKITGIYIVLFGYRYTLKWGN